MCIHIHVLAHHLHVTEYYSKYFFVFSLFLVIEYCMIDNLLTKKNKKTKKRQAMVERGWFDNIFQNPKVYVCLFRTLHRLLLCVHNHCKIVLISFKGYNLRFLSPASYIFRNKMLIKLLLDPYLHVCLANNWFSWKMQDICGICNNISDLVSY